MNSESRTATASQCCKRLYGGGRGFRGAPCSKKANVQVDGKWYCAIHDPVRVEERVKAKRARWEAEWAASAAKNKIQNAAPAMLAALIEARDQTNMVQHSQETRLNDIYDILTAAIAKATGRSVTDAHASKEGSVS